MHLYLSPRASKADIKGVKGGLLYFLKGVGVRLLPSYCFDVEVIRKGGNLGGEGLGKGRFMCKGIKGCL